MRREKWIAKSKNFFLWITTKVLHIFKLFLIVLLNFIILFQAAKIYIFLKISLSVRFFYFSTFNTILIKKIKTFC